VRAAGLLIAAAALAACAPVGLRAQRAPAQGQPIVLGQSYRIEAAAFGDERVINVALPADYEANPTKVYPVLYLIDGGVDQDFVHIVGAKQLGAAWGRMHDVIVVGIASKDRRRELVGPTRDVALLAKYPTAGHSAMFRRFLREEVKPFVATRFRTNGKSGVIGESLAGLFIAETYLREPNLFDAYAAISPSLWWDEARLTHEAAALIGPRQSGKRLYLATADEGADMQANVDRMLAALGKARDWCYAPSGNSTHATIYHMIAPTALQYLFPSDTPPDPQSGFDVTCSKRS
jgi:predicted alpha/beta superfamily hydrolase